MRAHQIMTPDVITIDADASIVAAADRMLRHHVSGLPVLDAAGQLIGIVSESDFLRRAELGTDRKHGRWLGLLIGPDRLASDFVRSHGRTVREIMTPDPLTVNEDTPLDQVARIMESHGVKRLPVIRGSQLVGMVTRADFLTAVAGLARDIAEPTAADDEIRRAVLAAIGHAAWRPCRLNVTVRDRTVSLRGVIRSDEARQAAVIAAENVPGVRKVLDRLSEAPAYPPPEQDLGGGDFVSLQAQPSTVDDEPL